MEMHIFGQYLREYLHKKIDGLTQFLPTLKEYSLISGNCFLLW